MQLMRDDVGEGDPVKQGQLVDKAIGARPKAALEQMLNKVL